MVKRPHSADGSHDAANYCVLRRDVGVRIAATTSAPTVSTTTTLVPVATTTVDPEALDLTHPDAPAPEVDLEAETWAELLRVWQDIEEYWVWMYAHPSDVLTIYSRCYQPMGQSSNSK